MSKIEWTDVSWNPIRARDRATGKVGWFCIHKSDGCKLCYAEPMNRRLGNGHPYKAQALEHVEVFVDESTLTQPSRWKRPRVIFPCSMTDLFGEFVTDAMIDAVVAEMAANPRHTFIVLTKRSDRMREYWTNLPARIGSWNADAGLDWVEALPLPNVWLGVSVESDRERDRVDELINTPAAVRLISMEPLLSAVDVIRDLDPGRCGCEFCSTTSIRCTASRHPIDWVIVGGESGAQARPCIVQNVASIVDQCRIADVPVFVKQLGRRPVFGETPLRFKDPKGGDMDEWPPVLRIRQRPPTAAERLAA